MTLFYYILKRESIPANIFGLQKWGRIKFMTDIETQREENHKRLLSMLTRADARDMLDHGSREGLELAFGEDFAAEVVRLAKEPKRGRPRKLESEKMPSHMIMMPDDLWKHCLSQEGGASPFLRRLVIDHINGQKNEKR